MNYFVKAKNNKHRFNQDGLASIFISMIIMVIVSLILIGFVQYSNSEQKQSLDRQLQDEAFYSAESGINQVVQALNNGASYSNTSNCTSAAMVLHLTTTFQYNNASIDTSAGK